jgi:hypothetical protein
MVASITSVSKHNLIDARRISTQAFNKPAYGIADMLQSQFLTKRLLAFASKGLAFYNPD